MNCKNYYDKTIIDFSRYSSIKIGSKHEVLILNFDILNAKLTSSGISFNKKISSCGPSFIKLNKNYHVIGLANNLLVSPFTEKNLAILGDNFNYILDIGNEIEIGAATNSINAFKFFLKNNLSGFEFLKHLPGQIGALTHMNAGMKSYEMKNIITSLNINGEWIDASFAEFKYRGRNSDGIIFAIRVKKIYGFQMELLNLFSNMRSNQPKNYSCGSCFKNPANDFAARLIEKNNLKGYFINNVGFSSKHANFLINLGRAKFEDALKIINLAKKKVFENDGIKLECEVKII